MRKNFLLFCKIALILVYLVIIAGAVVRMTGSGMGCPDWPKCFGYLIPPTEDAQLEWKSGHEYHEGEVIIIQESLRVAKDDFTSGSTYSETNWEPYTKHDYATFNVWHTWTEFINRLFGALAGLGTLLMAIASIWFWRKNKWITLLSWFVVFGMGFQAWLGKTVVDSNLQPFKITIHMVMALVIVAAILYVIHLAKDTVSARKKDKLFSNLLIAALVLTLIQTVLGTQVRQFVDEQVDIVGYTAKDLWLENPTLQFYVHRTFSFVVLFLNLFLLYRNRKLSLGFSKINWVMALLAIEVLSGIAMYYVDFPFGSQPLHLVIATVLFGVQFFLVLEARNASHKLETS